MKPYEQVQICFINLSEQDVLTTSTDPWKIDRMWEGVTNVE